MAGSAPIVEIEGLTFRYRRATDPAIREVSLQIDPGEILLVAGPSGCGKSTLIRAINGLIPHAYPGRADGHGPRRRPPDHRAEAPGHRPGRRDGAPGSGQADRRRDGRDRARLRPGEPRPAARRDPATDSARSPTRPAMRDSARTRDGGPLGRRAAAARDGRDPDDAAASCTSSTNRWPTSIRRPPPGSCDLLRRLADAGNAIVIVEHRVEEALDLRPDRVLYLEDGRCRATSATSTGFLEVADPAAVKLPFEVVLAHAAARSATAPRDGAGPPRAARGRRRGAGAASPSTAGSGRLRAIARSSTASRRDARAARGRRRPRPEWLGQDDAVPGRDAGSSR